jgi:hypothetical protein
MTSADTEPTALQRRAARQEDYPGTLPFRASTIRDRRALCGLLPTRRGDVEDRRLGVLMLAVLRREVLILFIILAFFAVELLSSVVAWTAQSDP